MIMMINHNLRNILGLIETSRSINQPSSAPMLLAHRYVNAGLNLHGSWPKEMMWNHLYYMNIPQYATDSAVELAAYHNSYNSNPGNFPTPAMNGQTLLNTVARSADHGEINTGEALAADAVTGVATLMTLRCGAKAPPGPKKGRGERRAREAALECLKRAMTASSRQE